MRRNIGYYVTALVVALGTLLSGCAAPQTPAPPPTPTPSRPATPAPTGAAQLPDEQRLIEGAKKEGEVMMWVVTWGPERGVVEKLFQAKYPFLKVTIADLPSNEDMMGRFIQEAKAGRHAVDLLYMSHLLADGREAGLLAEYDFTTRGWAQQPNHKFWMNLVVGGHVAMYNTELVSAAEAPKTYDDMKNPKWRGKTMLSTSAGDVLFRYAYMWKEGDKLAWDKAETYFKDLWNNTRPRVGRGMTSLVQLLAAGEFPLLPNIAVGPFITFQRKGAPVALVPLGQMPGNAFSVAIAKNAPHPNAARLWANFLTTPEIQLIVSEAQGNPPLNPEVARTSRIRGLLAQAGVEPLSIPDEQWTVDNLARAEKFWGNLLGIR